MTANPSAVARRALYQYQHDAINRREYPGTRQLCITCSEPTGRCEDDSLYVLDEGPLCEDCFDRYERLTE